MDGAMKRDKNTKDPHPQNNVDRKDTFLIHSQPKQ
jgi:hypothetical protein